jgi:hypothetical protein
MKYWNDGISPCDRNILLRPFDKPLGRESFDPELMTEGFEAEWLRASVFVGTTPDKTADRMERWKIGIVGKGARVGTDNYNAYHKAASWSLLRNNFLDFFDKLSGSL